MSFETRFYKWSGLWLALLLSFVMGIVACSAFPGYENVDTTRKAIVVANGEIAAWNSLLQDLIERRAISREHAERAHDALQVAKNHLQTALSAVDVAGDPVTATNSLDRANLAISVAIGLLAPLVET